MATSSSPPPSQQQQQQQISTHQTSTISSSNRHRGRTLRRQDPDNDEHESIELSPFPSLPSRSGQTAGPSSTATEQPDVDEIRRVPSSAHTTGSNLTRLNTVQSMWEEHVSTVVDAADCRDYLALERTFLGYLRTSVLLSLTGATVAQLYAIQAKKTEDLSGSESTSSSSSSSSSFIPHLSQLEQQQGVGDSGSHNGNASSSGILDVSFSMIGKPLATACYLAAIWTILAGAYRHWRYQRALKTRGTCFTGGIELASIWFLFLGLVVTFLAFTIVID